MNKIVVWGKKQWAKTWIKFLCEIIGVVIAILILLWLMQITEWGNAILANTRQQLAEPLSL